MMTPIRLVIHGAGGRMGQRLVALASEDRRWKVVAALESDGHRDLGQDAGTRAGIGPIGVPLTATLDADLGADCVIDFSVPQAAHQIAALCDRRKLPLVVATTGLSDADKDAVTAAARNVALVWAPNMSLAVNLSMKLATIAAQALRDRPGGADVEIVERHHRFKRDAPSGTALRFGELIAAALGTTRQVHGRQGEVGQRTPREIGYHAIRAGDNPGEHTIIFGMLGETIELTVRATNRDCYASGALEAARFVTRQPPGIYTMFDVLGL